MGLTLLLAMGQLIYEPGPRFPTLSLGSESQSRRGQCPGPSLSVMLFPLTLPSWMEQFQQLRCVACLSQ